MDELTFEERLLPLLVQELVARPQGSIDRRPRNVRAMAVLVAAVITAAVVVAFVTGGSSDGIVTATVASGSMLPTFGPGDVVAIDTNAYGTTIPSRGDIVAFRLADVADNIFFKRVIGLPGDTIEQVDGVVFVNGRELDETYAELDHGNGSWVVEAGHVFVLGDNRANSNDSRFVGERGLGQVPVTAIIGKVLPGTVSVAPDIPAGPAGVAPGP